jgi:hypothetical protein
MYGSTPAANSRGESTTTAPPRVINGSVDTRQPRSMAMIAAEVLGMSAIDVRPAA